MGSSGIKRAGHCHRVTRAHAHACHRPHCPQVPPCVPWKEGPCSGQLPPCVQPQGKDGPPWVLQQETRGPPCVQPPETQGPPCVPPCPECQAPRDPQAPCEASCEAS